MQKFERKGKRIEGDQGKKRIHRKVEIGGHKSGTKKCLNFGIYKNYLD